MSIWMKGENYFIPETYDLYISRGGAGAGIKVTVRTKGQTQIDAEALGTSGKLMDGGFCFRTQEFCPGSYTRYRMNTCRLECCLQEYISELVERSARDSQYEVVQQIERLISISKREAEIGNIEYALSVYEEAKQAVEDLNCNCKCLK